MAKKYLMEQVKDSNHEPAGAGPRSQAIQVMYDALVQTIRQVTAAHDYTVGEVNAAVLQFAANVVISNAVGLSEADQHQQMDVVAEMFQRRAHHAVTLLHERRGSKRCGGR